MTAVDTGHDRSGMCSRDPRRYGGSAALLRAVLHFQFRFDEPLPFPPGRSSYHVRGLYYDRLLAYAKSVVGESAPLFESIEDSHVRAFARQRFSWTGWYDALPAALICASFARFIGQDFEAAVREHTRRGALQVIPSAFRFAFRIPGPSALQSQTAQIVALMTNFAEVRIERSTETHSSGWTRGVPVYLATHWANTTTGFFQALYELRGAADVRARYTDIVEDGGTGSSRTVAIRHEFDWRMK
jgi:hypothetical protein